MRILYLNPFGDLGGAERALLDLIAAVREALPAWKLYLISSGEGRFPERARLLGVDCRVLPFPALIARTGDAGEANSDLFANLARAGRLCAASLVGTSYVARLRAAIRQIAPDILHTNGFKMHIAGALARPAESTLIWHVRDYVSTRPVMSRVLPMLRARCALAIANSRSVAADVAKCCPGLEVRTAYDALDLNEFSAAGTSLDLDTLAHLPPAPDGTIRIGMLATMAKWKGQEVFLEALARLSSESRVRGYIIGGALYETDGSQYSVDYLRRASVKLGVAGRVGFTGFVNDPAAAMRALDIVVHASTRPEPFGLTIAEAMACEKPLISTAYGGASELVTDGVNSLIVPPNDAARLAESIDRLAGDAALRKRLSVNGRASAEAKFDRRRLAGEVAEIYRGIAARAAA